MNNERIAIIGGGSAGLLCAFLLGSYNKKVTVFEKAEKTGRKLAITGGGYCNFSNQVLSSDCYVPGSAKNFIDSMLACYNSQAAKNLVNNLGFNFEEKDSGRLFLDKPARAFVCALENKCKNVGIEILCNHCVDKIDAERKLVFFDKDYIKASRIIMAQGSNAGITNKGGNENLSLALQTGHKIKLFSAGLVPLEFDRNSGLKSRFAPLAGISVNARIILLTKYGERSFSGPLLFTHYGLSGPAILDCSLYWENKTVLKIDFLPGHNFEKMLDDYPRSTPLSLCRRYIPNRLAEALFPFDLAHIKNGQLSREQRKLLAEQVHQYLFSGLHRGAIKNAEVCMGGVECDQINPHTMQSLIYPDIYFIGEMINITGRLGGYNLHWAFGSATLAASHICEVVNFIRN